MKIIQPDKYHSKQKASHLIDSLPISTPKNISIEDICHLNNLTVKASSHIYALGQMIRIGERGIINYSSSITSEGRRRFTIAHEFGHYYLHKNIKESFNCTEKDMQKWFFSDIELETSANIFAAELLMPEKFANKIVNNSEVSLDSIQEIANTFQTSFLASAIRYIELNETGCMLVMSYQGKVEWVKKNSTFQGWINPKEKIHKLTCAHGCLSNNKEFNKPEQIPSHAWLPDLDQNLEVYEHSKRITEDRVVSLLYLNEVDEDEIEGLYDVAF